MLELLRELGLDLVELGEREGSEVDCRKGFISSCML